MVAVGANGGGRTIVAFMVEPLRLFLPAKLLMLNVQRRRPAVFSFGIKTYPASMLVDAAGRTKKKKAPCGAFINLHSPPPYPDCGVVISVQISDIPSGQVLSLLAVKLIR